MSSLTPPPVAPPSPSTPAQPPHPTVAFELAWFPKEQDWVEAFAAVGRARRRKAAGIIAIPAGLLIAVGLMSGDPTSVAVGVTLLVVFAIALGPLRQHSVRTTVRRYGLFQYRRHVQVSPEAGISEWSGLSFSANAWPRYAAVIETKRAFALVIGDAPGSPIQLLAKRGLPPDVDPQLLGDFLRGWVGPGPAARR